MLTTTKLAGQNCLVARTGHTGQPQGYEIFLSQDVARKVWEEATARGVELGLRQVGWDAWHTAGVASGLALDGHELGGIYSISPIEAGFGAVVRAHKPFFIGRDPLLRQPYPPSRLISRFRIVDSNAAALNPGDPIVDDGSKCVGWVTSISPVASESVGLMLGTRECSSVGARLIALSGGPAEAAIGQSLVSTGIARVSVEVLPRSPK
jgi:glycine cleavage system aminomethyltransferase T